MGRLVKRVKKDFNYPIGKIWYGYINPYIGCECPVCKGSGYSEKGMEYHDKWYDFDGETAPTKSGGVWHPNAHRYNLEQFEVDALWNEGRLMKFSEKPTAEQVNEWARNDIFGGHDSMNEWICMQADAKKNGYDLFCPYCNGEGYICDVEARDKWKHFEPEEGDYYQLWGDTSEGSPMTPPFETQEELARYCADNNISIFGSDTLTYEKWLEFIKNGKVQSMNYIVVSD